MNQSIALLCLTLASPSIGAAQSLSVADLQKHIDAEVRKENDNEYIALLNDPDPKRAQAAMKVMMASGDKELRRMAIEFGLYSADPKIQRQAILGVLDAKPNLTVFIDGSKQEAGSIPARNFQTRVGNKRGSIDEQGIARVNYAVGSFDEKQGCYIDGDTHKKCLIVLSGGGITANLLQGSFDLTLNDQGELAGVGGFPYVDAPIGVRVRLLD